MKELLLTICILIGINSYAQTSEIPSNVIDTFENMYPEAENVEWKTQKNTYQAEFIDLFQTIAVFNKEGLWMKTISQISEYDLPDAAFENIDENYEFAEYYYLHMIEDNKHLIIYKVVLLVDEEKVTLRFSEDGEEIK